VGDEDPRLLPGQRRRDLGEAGAQDVVHAERHVLDPPADEQDDAGVGRRGGQLGELAQRVEGLGRLRQDEAGAGEQVGVQRQGPVPAGQPGALRVGGECLLADQQVLVHPDVACARRRPRPG
jgi:hypothetical protein